MTWLGGSCRWLLLVATAGCATAPGWAPAPPPWRGDISGPELGVRATAHPGKHRVAFTIELENHSDDPLAVDVDALVLRHADGSNYRVLGKRADDAVDDPPDKPSRAPHGSLNVAPHASASFEAEFPAPPAGRVTLLVPRIYQLNIEGQVQLAALRVPLVVDKPAVPDAGFYDPFVE